MFRETVVTLLTTILLVVPCTPLFGERREGENIRVVSSTSFLARGRDSWAGVRSQHLQVIGNTSERELRQVAMRLEQFRAIVSQLFTKISGDSPVPTTVIVFKDDASYGPFKRNENNAGYFQPGQDVNYISLSTESRGEQDSGSVTLHEFMHLLINNSLGNSPAWFNEGLAELCSTLSITGDRRVVFGRPISRHITVLRQNPLLPLRTLFEVDYKSPYYNETQKQSIFYAESWALVHYLMLNKSGARAAQVMKFLELLQTENSLDTAFQKAFSTTFQGMEGELRSYMVQNRFQFVESIIAKRLPVEYPITSVLISDAQLQAYLGDLLVHSNHAGAETYLERALTLDPNLRFAHESMGILRFRQGNNAEALPHLERAIAADSQNGLVHYYYASILCRPPREDDLKLQLTLGYTAETAAKARAQLKRAIELRPDFADSYNLLAYINLVTGTEIDETIQLLKAALERFPGRIDFRYMLGQLYMQKDDYKQARPLLDQVLKGNVEASVSNHVQMLLKTITDVEGQQQAAREAALRARGLTREPSLQSAIGMAFTDPSSSLRETLRIPPAGEAQIQGVLLAIECDQSGLVFTVKTSDRMLRLRTESFQKIRRTTYTADVKGTITCGARKPENPVVVCYLPGTEKRNKTDGVLSSVEFVPADFKLKP